MAQNWSSKNFTSFKTHFSDFSMENETKRNETVKRIFYELVHPTDIMTKFILSDKKLVDMRNFFYSKFKASSDV